MDLCKIHLHSIVKLETAKKLTKVVKETEKRRSTKHKLERTELIDYLQGRNEGCRVTERLCEGGQGIVTWEVTPSCFPSPRRLAEPGQMGQAGAQGHWKQQK